MPRATPVQKKKAPTSVKKVAKTVQKPKAAAKVLPLFNYYISVII